MKKVLCIGELLIDFFATDVQQSLHTATTFEKRAGGAPANVAAAIAKLGGKAYFCGKVGDDAFGHFLKDTLQQAGVCTEQLVLDATCATTLAFVSRDVNGERDFVFSRGADALLRIEDLQLQKLMTMDIIHFGSATALLSEPFRQTYAQLMQTLLLQNHFISFDPNYRENLWQHDTERFIEQGMPFLEAAHFIKMSHEELLIFARTNEFDEALDWLSQFKEKTIAITQGAAGTIFIQNGVISVVPSIPVKAIDTTGAGDAFVGAILYELSNRDIATLTHAQWLSVIAFANRVGAKVCEKVGAIEALPTLEEAK